MGYYIQAKYFEYHPYNILMTRIPTGDNIT